MQFAIGIPVVFSGGPLDIGSTGCAVQTSHWWGLTCVAPILLLCVQYLACQSSSDCILQWWPCISNIALHRMARGCPVGSCPCHVCLACWLHLLLANLNARSQCLCVSDQPRELFRCFLSNRGSCSRWWFPSTGCALVRISVCIWFLDFNLSSSHCNCVGWPTRT